MTIALSWSRWSDYDQCALKFALKYVRKAPNFQEDPKKKSVHLQRGENLHKQLEDFAIWRLTGSKGDMPNMSPETTPLAPMIDRLIATSEFVLPETQMAVNSQWQKIEWFDKKAHYRAIMDLIAGRTNHGILWDYKSGKYAPYADECGQLHLSSAMVIKMKGWDYVDTSYLFLDSKQPSTIRVTQDEVPKIIQIFDERHARVNAEVNWPAKQNANCQWCQATKDQCVYSKKTPNLGQAHGF